MDDDTVLSMQTKEKVFEDAVTSGYKSYQSSEETVNYYRQFAANDNYDKVLKHFGKK